MSKNTDTDDGYGIAYLASELDMDPANVRNALRRLNVEKTENRYSWSRKSEADAVVKRIRDNKREQPAALKKGKADAAEKPAKGAKVNKDAVAKGKDKAKDAKAAKGKDAKPAKGKDKPAKGDKKAKAKDEDEE